MIERIPLTYEILPLRKVLEHIEELPWKYALYVASDAEWAPNARAAVLDPDDITSDDPDADVAPEFALSRGLKCALGIADVRDVIANAKAQLERSPSLDETLGALRFYYRNDAFMVFNRGAVR
jgi:hypothetical protein